MSPSVLLSEVVAAAALHAPSLLVFVLMYVAPTLGGGCRPAVHDMLELRSRSRVQVAGVACYWMCVRAWRGLLLGACMRTAPAAVGIEVDLLTIYFLRNQVLPCFFHSFSEYF